MQVSAQSCEDETVKLQKGLWMMCVDGAWVPRESRRGSSAPPCEDDAALTANGTCAADRSHCHQYTEAGAEMTRDCPGTCGQMLCRQIIINLTYFNLRFL